MPVKSASLDDVMRALVAKGEFSHLSIAACAGGFSASFAHASSQGVSYHRDPDPVAAALAAIAAAPVKLPKIGKASTRETDDDMEFG